MNLLIQFWPSLVGGALIGLAAALLLLLIGRIAGISGIVGNLLHRPDSATSWRAAFVVGLIGGPLLFRVVSGQAPVIEITTSPLILLIAGLLVGFGSRLGAGCTSGHGVCGLARLSPRSIVAVGVFMLAAIMTVFIRNHLA